jgi:protein-S-isoprenylcysteine O-methyltransferase Ste14
MHRLGTFLFAWRNWLFTAALLGLLLFCPPVLLFGSRNADFWMDLVGFAVTLAGQGIRTIVIGQTRIESGGSRKKVAAQSLVTRGLLNHVRNPLYIGNLLVVAGLAVIHNNPWVYLLLLPAACIGYQAIVTSEEAYLTQRFGTEYQTYCQRVRRWLPNLRGIGNSLREIPLDWRRILLQEYGSLYLAVALPLALMIYEQLLGPASPGRQGRLSALAWALVLATLAWAWLRRMKLAEVARRRSEAASAALST